MVEFRIANTLTNHLHIRTAVESDTPVILEMIRALAGYERLLHQVTATEDLLRASLFSEKPAAEVLLAFREAQPVGFALFFSTYSTFLAKAGIYLEDLYVKPEVRGQGIGFALLTRLAQLAVERGCRRVEWEVLDWNAPSIAFYKKLGAQPLDDWTRYRLTGNALLELGRL